MEVLENNIFAFFIMFCICICICMCISLKLQCLTSGATGIAIHSFGGQIITSPPSPPPPKVPCTVFYLSIQCKGSLLYPRSRKLHASTVHLLPVYPVRLSGTFIRSVCPARCPASLSGPFVLPVYPARLSCPFIRPVCPARLSCPFIR